MADIAKLSVGREEYYTRELAIDHEAYLSGHGESRGRWYGAGADSLGLEGEASTAGFQAMFEGRHPDSGELLGRPHGGVQHVSGQGVLAVGSTTGPPGRVIRWCIPIWWWPTGSRGRTALDGRDLYRHRLAADTVYRATYQRELVRTLGVEWTPADGHGNRELAGMPEALVRGFSKPTGQIELEVERLEAEGGERTPRLVKWAVQATRKPKQHEAPESLYGRWRAEAAERGVDPDSLVREVTGRTANRVQDQTVSNEVAGRLFDWLAGPEGLTEHASTFTRPDGPSWRRWPIGSWPSGRSAWSPTGPWRSAAGPPRSCWRSSSGWSLGHQSDGGADGHGLPRGGA